MMTDTADAAHETNHNRQVMAQLLDSLDFREDIKDEVKLADYYIDEALDVLETEEPSLLEWIQTDEEVDRLRWTNRSTTYWLMMAQMKKQVPLEKIVGKVDNLFGRVLAAVAWRAVMKDRERR